MVRSAVAFAAIAVGLLREPGCGGADSPSGGPNAPCTRSKDCSTGLSCSEGVCTDPDGGPPGSVVPDAGRDAAVSGDAADDGG